MDKNNSKIPLIRSDVLLDIFVAKESEYEAKAELCREWPRDRLAQALHAGFAAGMRFAVEQVRSMVSAQVPLPTEQPSASHADKVLMKSVVPSAEDVIADEIYLSLWKNPGYCPDQDADAFRDAVVKTAMRICHEQGKEDKIVQFCVEMIAEWMKSNTLNMVLSWVQEPGTPSFRAEVKRIANDYIPDNDRQSPQALAEMREALQSLLANTEVGEMQPLTGKTDADSMLQLDRPFVYLACPYNHKDRAVRVKRFEAVNRAAAKLMCEGQHVLSPISQMHTIAEAGNLPTGWDYWQQYDRAYLTLCHKLIVLKLDGWQESKGVTEELAIAKELGLTVEYMEEV